MLGVDWQHPARTPCIHASAMDAGSRRAALAAGLAVATTALQGTWKRPGSGLTNWAV